MLTRNISQLLEKSKKSILLLGPRQVGKSTLIRSLSPDISINLAHEGTFLDFSRNPLELENRLDALKTKKRKVFIDEVQRLPSILNSIQVLLDAEPNNYKFYLTGSSARKLKRGEANLLPGRVQTYHMGPLSARELEYKIDPYRAMSTGTLPGIWYESSQQECKKTLRSYASSYLREEVQAESLTKNLEGFARFLDVVVGWSGHFLDLSKMASAAHVARQSTVRWFEILEDTLLIKRVLPFEKSTSPRLVQHPKFYFFDIGVLNGLLGNFGISQDRIGLLFEHLIVSQLWTSAHALDQEIKLSTFRTEHGSEVDLIIEHSGKIFAVELKASTNVGISDLKGLKKFGEYLKGRFHPMVFYLGKVRKKIDNIDVLPWQEGLQEIGL